MTALFVDYAVAFPVAGMRDFVDDVSFRGVGFELRYFLLKHLSLGAAGSWQLFTDRIGKTTYPIEAGALTARLYTSAELVPLRGTMHLYAGKLGPAKPYAGVGVGASSVYFQTLAADLASVKSEWYFTVTPELGCMFGFDVRDRSAGVNLAARYMWLPASYFLVDGIQTLSGHIGFYSAF